MKVWISYSKILSGVIGFTLVFGFLPISLNAAVVTWDGGAANRDDWSGSGGGGKNGDNNWNLNAPPTNGDSLIFAGNTRLTPNNNIVGLQITGIEFASGAGAFILGGNQLILTAGSITNNSTNLQTINMALGLNATITLNAASGDVAIGGVVTGTLGITKTGTNNLFLTAANLYTGTTTISAGTLLANNASGSATGTGAVIVGASGTLGGTGTISQLGINGITVNGTIAPGSGSTPGTLTVNLTTTTGGIVMNSGSGFQYHLGAAGVGDLFALLGASSGDFTFNNNNINFMGTGAIGSYKLFDTDSANSNTWNGLTVNGSNKITDGLTYSNLSNGYSAFFYLGGGSFGGDSGDIYVKVIPEPSAAILLSLGALTLAFRRQRASA